MIQGVMEQQSALAKRTKNSGKEGKMTIRTELVSIFKSISTSCLQPIMAQTILSTKETQWAFLAVGSHLHQ